MPARDQQIYLHLAHRISTGQGLSFGRDLAYLKHRMRGESLLGEAWQGDPDYVFGITPAGEPTATVEPGYPLLLALAFTVTGYVSGSVFLVNTVAFLLGALALHLLVRRHWGDRAALAASVVWSVYPYYVYYSAYAMSEAVHVAMLPICFLLADLAAGSERRGYPWSLAAGMGGGILFLIRSTTLPLVAVLAAWTALRSGRGRRIPGTALLVAGFAVAVSPWVARNWVRLGEPVLLPTKGSLNLWMRNNPEMLGLEGFDIPRNIAESIERPELLEYPVLTDHQGELERSAALQRRAMTFIGANPLLFLYLGSRRLLAFLSPLGSSGGGLIGLLSGLLIYLPLLIGAAWQAARGWRDPLVVLLASSFILYLLIHTLAHGGIRYRLPVDGCLIALCSRWLAVRGRKTG